LGVAVNLSVRNLHEPDIVNTIDRLLAESGVGAPALTIELTESSLMADPERAISTLEQLDRLGARIAVDDFGTGYSSLSYLKRVPVHEIKIDRSFVTDVGSTGLIIVRSVIDLGHNLHLQVVAEGVEDLETWDTLAHLDCDVAQGYYLSRPLPASEIPGWAARFEAQTPAHAGQHTIVLVVDDNPVYLSLLQRVFSREGWSVVTAASGEEALGLLRSVKPSILVTDVMLPGISGIDTVARIRSLEVGRRLPAITITATPTDEQRDEALHHGSDVYVPKPADHADLVHLVRQTLTRRTEIGSHPIGG
jgi:CheY-like chemotaxis protein